MRPTQTAKNPQMTIYVNIFFHAAARTPSIAALQSASISMVPSLPSASEGFQ
jgi:hypothetical protein